MAIFTQQEIERRRTAVIERMRTSGIQCAIAATPWNVYYLTGMLVMHTWGRPNVALVNADGRSCLIGPAGERLNAERNAWVDEIISFGDARNVLAAIRDSAADVLRRFGCEGKRLGFERTAAPHGMVMDLCEALRWDAIRDLIDPRVGASA